MDDLCATRARQPDVAVVEAAVQVAAPLVLADKGHQSVEDSWHGGGENITVLTPLLLTTARYSAVSGTRQTRA